MLFSNGRFFLEMICNSKSVHVMFYISLLLHRLSTDEKVEDDKCNYERYRNVVINLAQGSEFCGRERQREMGDGAYSVS